MESMLAAIFGGDFPKDPLEPWQVAARAICVYFIGLVIIRVGKSRVVGRVSAALVGAHYVLTAIATRYHRFGNLVKGHAVPLVKEGVIIEESMRRCHISNHDLIEAMRLKGVTNCNEILLAIKERNGEISIINRPEA